MEELSCFNCHHKNLTHENVFNVTEIRKTIASQTASEKGLVSSDPKQNGVHDVDKENVFHVVCADCVYDRLQICKNCSNKAPLCMFKVGEWFNPKENRICIDCAAATESSKLLKDGCEMASLIQQCFRCGHFKYLPSFMISSKFSLDKIPRECNNCLLKADIRKYKKDLHERYESKWREEPVLVSKRKSSSTKVSQGISQSTCLLSYASVVTKGSSGRDLADLNLEEEGQICEGATVHDREMPKNKMLKLTTFSASINETICESVLQSLKCSFYQLEEKTKLELELMQLDSHLCHGILRDKLIRVSHRFSKQGTQQTLFDDAESRWAYMGTYTVAHASLVHATLQSGIFPPLEEFIKKIHKGKKMTLVCSFGAGPGSEVLGLSQHFPLDTEWVLLDNCENWEHLAQVLLMKTAGISFQYGTVDVTKPVKTSPNADFLNVTFKKAKLMIFVKFISAVQNQPGAKEYLTSIIRSCSTPGTLFLFIDNAHIQTKTFIEDLVFGGENYVDHGDFKESEFFTLYTTYAELKSEGEDALRSAVLCDWVGYITYWLDRWPTLDLRVNVLLAVKKNKLEEKHNN